MKISAVISFLESIAPPSLQEPYDNAGLITGDAQAECSGVLCALDSTEEIVDEAIRLDCNLIVAHHPILFKGLKKLTGSNYVERTVIKAIRNGIAIYAIHTNLDNVIGGVNGRMARLLQLQHISPLVPAPGLLKKLYSFVPIAQAERVRGALFAAGAGRIGNYEECSFNAEGMGTFTAGEGANPFVGQIGQRHEEPEIKLEVIFPAWLEGEVIRALLAAHPYEKAAYDIVALQNLNPEVGGGLIGELETAMGETAFLGQVKRQFGIPVIRHSPLPGKPIRKVALCGGAGSSLISNALRANADIYLTADLKYHEFFEGDGRMVIADIGHYESEQFTMDLLKEVIEQKFPNFAVLKTGLLTNPVRYFSN